VDPVIAGALIALAGAGYCSVALLRGVLALRSSVAPSSPLRATEATPEQLRRTLGILLWSFATGLAALAVVCLALALAIPSSPGMTGAIPGPVAILAGATVALAAVAILGTWGRFGPAMGAPGSDAVRQYRRALIAGVAWEAPGIVGVTVLLLAAL
jgi:hypothetical protein